MTFTAAQLDEFMSERSFTGEYDEEYYGWDTINEDGEGLTINTPFGQLETVVYNDRELDRFGDRVVFHIVKVGDRYFKKEGWYDSWGGDSGWDAALYEVVEKEVVTKVWEKKND